MMLLTALACALQVSASPLDAFQANLASIRGRVEFEMKVGQIDGNAIASGAVWSGELPEYVGLPRLSVFGVWESDGKEEHIIVEPTADAVAADKAKPEVGLFRSLPVGVEQISNGESSAIHLLDGSLELSLIKGADAGWVKHHPFQFMRPEPLPSMIQLHFGDAKPTYEKADQGGVPCEVAVYRQYVDGEWKYSLEVSYDAATGYLPRLIREISSMSESPGDANVSEAYIVAARRSQGGGFVPTKWYRAGYTVKGLFADRPAYRVNSPLKPMAAKCSLTSFEATKFGDLEGPIRLNRLEDIRSINGVERMKWLEDAPSTLTISEIKTLLKSGGKRPTNALIPNIDIK